LRPFIFLLLFSIKPLLFKVPTFFSFNSSKKFMMMALKMPVSNKAAFQAVLY